MVGALPAGESSRAEIRTGSPRWYTKHPHAFVGAQASRVLGVKSTVPDCSISVALRHVYKALWRILGGIELDVRPFQREKLRIAPA